MKTFKKTDVQKAALRLLRSKAVYILLYGGSRSGKTFILLYAIITRALKAPGSRHLILRHRFNQAKTAIWYDNLPKVFKICFPTLKYTENKSDWFIEFPNGSQIWIGGLDDKERTEKILGNEYSTIYFNESSTMHYDSIAIVLTRLAENVGLINKAYFDCNPPSPRHWSYLLFVKNVDPETGEKKDKDLYAYMLMNPADNTANLPKDYIKNFLDSLPERKRKRFRDGLWLDDNEHALWKRIWIDESRVFEIPDLIRIVIAVDPSGSDNENSDECGIIVVGEGRALRDMAYPDHSHFYVLDDFTQVASPAQWAKEAVMAFHKYKADRIVAEKNFGGDMVKTTIQNIHPNVPITLVWASKGKFVRAEPVSALYEEKKVHHVSSHPELEDELCNWEPTTKKSPNRLDALVWGISHLAGLGAPVEAPSVEKQARRIKYRSKVKIFRHRREQFLENIFYLQKITRFI